MSETIWQFWLLYGFLQNKDEVGDFSWWLSKVESVTGCLKCSSCTFSPCFETKTFFSRAVISVFNAFKMISMSQLSAESNFLLMIKFNSLGVLETIIGISKGPYLSSSWFKFFKLRTCVSIVSKSFLSPLTSLRQ